MGRRHGWVRVAAWEFGIEVMRILREILEIELFKINYIFTL